MGRGGGRVWRGKGGGGEEGRGRGRRMDMGMNMERGRVGLFVALYEGKRAVWRRFKRGPGWDLHP